MTAILMFLVLCFLHIVTGFGFLSLFRIRLRPGLFISISLIAGIGIFSLLPFLLQLLRIPLTGFSVWVSIVITVILLNLKAGSSYRFYRSLWKGIKIRFRIYEIPAFLLIAFLVFASVWRCFYYPPFPRDLTSGAEAIAEYTVREKTMINSVFSVNLESTNNQFKPPFLTSLQIIYKYAGFPFGQVWLSLLFISFLVFLYHFLIRHLHRLIAGLFLVFFICIPEMYAYTFMVLYDYSNAVFFCVAVFFLLEYLEKPAWNSLGAFAIFMAFATYVRAETLVLIFLLMPVLFIHHVKNWDGLRRIIKSAVIFLFPAIIVYLLSVVIFISYYLPVDYPVKNLVNSHPWDLSPFFKRFADMNNQLIFSGTGVNYYGYFIFFFLMILLLDIVLTDKWTMTSKNILFTIFVVYIGLPFMGFLLPLFDLDHTTKRGLFKIFPLMLLYIGSSGVLSSFSGTITRWEEK
jgi:hypothetical protein